MLSDYAVIALCELSRKLAAKGDTDSAAIVLQCAMNNSGPRAGREPGMAQGYPYTAGQNRNERPSYA